MKELTDFDTQNMHMQMIGKADFKDVIAYREVLRRRRINICLWILLLFSILFGYFIFSIGMVSASYYLFVFALLILIVLIFRYGLPQKIRLKRNIKEWESLREVPSWVYRKMKRRRTNRVNGEHYIYKKEGHIYYRKLK